MDDLVEWLRLQLDEDEQLARAAAGPSPGGGEWMMSDTGRHPGYTPEQAEHIALHDPARVLREVEAKRRLIGAHPELDRCTACAAGESGRCPNLRLLALPYSDRPGYREEWKPNQPEEGAG